MSLDAGDVNGLVNIRECRVDAGDIVVVFVNAIVVKTDFGRIRRGQLLRWMVDWDGRGR